MGLFVVLPLTAAHRYMELHNIDAGVRDELYKLASVRLCPNVDGQMMVSLMTNPPVEGDASYVQYRKEVDDIFSSLARRAKVVYDALNALEGVSCQPCVSSMYAFPSITIPPAAVAEAKAKGQAADLMYSLQLLEATGTSVCHLLLCTSNGSFESCALIVRPSVCRLFVPSFFPSFLIHCDNELLCV